MNKKHNSPQRAEVPLEALMPLILERIDQGQTVRFYPRGISMLPMLRPGVDSVELSAPPAKLRKFDLILYRRENGAYVLHRIVKTGQSYCCAGDNQLPTEKGVQRSQILAAVTAFYRKERRFSVRHPGYRIYCLLRHIYRRSCQHRVRRQRLKERAQ